MKEFFDVLFDDGEGICCGDAFAVEVKPWYVEGEYFCINPLSTLKDFGYFSKSEYNEFIPRRADINVTIFRNFLFEMDSVKLEDQLKILQGSEIPFTSIVYSGGKSYHAILSVEGGLQVDPHTLEALDAYKAVWMRLAAKLDREAKTLGLEYKEGHKSFIDHSCKNPSRLSRFPEVFRGKVKQELVSLTERISAEEFEELLDKCPRVQVSSRQEFNTPEDVVESVEVFKAVCPVGLLRKLKYVDWAADEGMYKELYRLSLWAFDETNVSKETLLEFMEEYTFKALLESGYPASKLQIGVDHAYREWSMKRGRSEI